MLFELGRPQREGTAKNCKMHIIMRTKNTRKILENSTFENRLEKSTRILQVEFLHEKNICRPKNWTLVNELSSIIGEHDKFCLNWGGLGGGGKCSLVN